jgi:hypothetical protein
MQETLLTLVLDLAKCIIPVLIFKYQWDSSLLMYSTPLLLLVIYIFQHLPTYIQIPGFPNKCSITLKHMIGSGSYYTGRADRNFYYAVIHYITTHKIIHGNYFVPSAMSYVGSENSDHIVAMKLALAKTRPIRITYNQVELSIQGHYVENDKYTSLYLTITGPHIAIIRQFLYQCHDEYEQSLRCQQGSRLSTFILDGKDWVHRGYNLNKSFRNLYIDAKIKSQIESDVKIFLNGESRYRQLGVPYKRGYLFYGKPGMGKSSTYYAMADRAKYNIYKLTMDPSTSIKSVKRAISQIPPKSILVIDDVDRIHFTTEPMTKCPNKKLKSSSDSNDEDGSSQFNLQNLLAILDGYEYLDNCLVVMTSNYKEKLDPALIRSGRIDLKVEIGYPNETTVNEMFHELYPDAVELNWSTTCHIPMADLIQHVVLPNATFAEARKTLQQMIESSPASPISPISPTSSPTSQLAQSGELINLIENNYTRM